ncbi:phosphomevalonate kinase [Malassezia yamatoensis]|uniref:phosphomevalonate kinase n=1 Tax=Malassezia yamatoensis TaxID=253288 RepID=A0AAJ6CJ37_9BASI|nr:phosphomevalonate kinase [Malassezia yamatoensis]
MITTVSAPGKVLVAGGYLVLDPRYFGLVLATNARFYTCVSQRNESSIPTVSVRSAQFLDAEWVYQVHLPTTDDTWQCVQGMWIAANEATSRNPFVALSLLYALQLGIEKLGPEQLRQKLGAGLEITIVGDNDYYSHRVEGRAASIEELQALPPFALQHCFLADVHKTGLGSSAAMTTSLIGALLVHLEIVDYDRNTHEFPLESLAWIHNTGQLAHCAAQGKVGSGFDVSSSVWGSQLYRRFDASLIQPVMRDESGIRIVYGAQEPLQHKQAPESLLPILDPMNVLWKAVPPDTQGIPSAVEGMLSLNTSLHTGTSTEIPRPAPLQLPPGVRLCLADVDAGSNTRTLVGQVRAFQQSKPEWALQLFRVLGSANQSFVDGLLGLHVMHARDPAKYMHTLTDLSGMPSKQWDEYRKQEPSLIVDMFLDVRDSIRSVRAGMRELGNRASAPVEPREMTDLLDSTINEAPGILGGGVPGAGGYDALYLLVLDSDLQKDLGMRPSAMRKVDEIWREYSNLSVGPLLCEAEKQTAGIPSEQPTESTSQESTDGTDPAVLQVMRKLLNTRTGLRCVDPHTIPGLDRFL